MPDDHTIEVFWKDRRLNDGKPSVYSYASRELLREHWNGFKDQPSVIQLVHKDETGFILNFWYDFTRLENP